MCGYPRKLEKFFTVTPWIAEFWNSISNLPFIIIGLFRLFELNIPSDELSKDFQLAYTLMIFAGIASFIHHATTPKWTILIDWIPIVLSIVFVLHKGWVMWISWAVLTELNIALCLLVVDHVWTLVPVPFGHCCWHIVACFAIDSAYQQIILNKIIASL